VLTVRPACRVSVDLLGSVVVGGSRHARSRSGNLARMTEMSPGDELLSAIRVGDVDWVARLLASDGDLASASLGGGRGTQTPLHVVAGWPGYYPNGPEIALLLIRSGAAVDARTTGRDPANSGETPLHWAASNDDVDVARVLIDGGADLEASDGSIGTPLENAIGYACLGVARLLVDRGAKVEKLWTAGALGMVQRLRELVDSGQFGPEDLSQGFWHACAAGQRRAAEFLLGEGADLNWVPEYASGTPLDTAQGVGTQQENVITWLRELGARSAQQAE
jgi:ankyrin repeat protein